MDRTKQILRILKKNRDGLTTTDIAKECGVSRATILADIKALLYAKKIRVQEAGTARIYHVVRA
jgi:DeoR/GlpR family transcriptional regulator of sugar metabolism